MYCPSVVLERAIHNWANWQDDGVKKDTMGLGKADLPVLRLEVNGAYPVFYLYL